MLCSSKSKAIVDTLQFQVLSHALIATQGSKPETARRSMAPVFVGIGSCPKCDGLDWVLSKTTTGAHQPVGMDHSSATMRLFLRLEAPAEILK